MSNLSALTVSKDGFAFNTTTGESYTLNDCARIILHRLSANETQEQIVQTIASEFGMAHYIVERDVSDFMQQLRTLGLTGAQA